MSAIERFLSEVGTALPAGALFLDEAARRACSEDVFLRCGDAVTAAAVIRPRKEADVCTVVERANRCGTRIRVRGGGLSYSGGYRPTKPDDVLLDMSAMAGVLHVDPDNLTVTVQAGCTWQTLLDTLKPLGLDAAIPPPVSGSHSTIGGAVSQGLPGDLSGILGVSVVLGNGALVTTGSAGVKADGPAFNRNVGPDFTGLFIGDCGAYGVKTRVTLRVRRRANTVLHASMLFEDLPSLAAAAGRIGASGLTFRCLGLDPRKNRSAKQLSFAEKLGELRAVGRDAGIVEALKIGLGGLFSSANDGWVLHCTVEGDTAGIARAKLAAVRRLGRNRIREIVPVVPRLLYSRPFSVRGAAGRRGEAWVPVHGVVPLSNVEVACAALTAFERAHAAEFERQNIEFGLLLSSNGPYVLFEPMLQWPDALAPVVRDAIGEDRLSKLETFAPDPSTRRRVAELRAALRDVFAAVDATHLQYGRFYAYLADDETSGLRRMARGLRDLLDENRTINAGILDL